MMLFIPDSKLIEIEGEYRSDEECEVAVIRYWILRDPFASWRRLINQLEDLDKHDHTIALYHYSEELTGMLGALTTHLMYAPQLLFLVHVHVPMPCNCIYGKFFFWINFCQVQLHILYGNIQ